MRVQCEQCGAAYSVADDKVAGRKLKQKCRKCGAQMVIDGTALERDQTPMAVPAVPGARSEEAAWHIAVGDTTQGPYTLEELAQYYADGSVVLDTLVCRDGWNDWKPAGEVPELVGASRGPSLLSVPPPQAIGALQPPPALGQPVTMGRDPFADAPVDGSPRVSVEEMQTPGAQRDGTVQFSMDQIRALSAVSSPSVPAPAPVTMAGHAAGDDSGLIDMRALAEAEAKAAAEAAQAALSPASAHAAYRPLRTSEIGPMSGISPLTLGNGPSSGLDFRTKVLASVAAFAVLTAAAVAIIVVLRSGPTVAAEAPVTAAAAAVVPTAAAAPAVAAASVTPAAALAAAVTPPRAAARDDERDESSDQGSAKRSHHASRKGRRGGDAGGTKASAHDEGSVDDIMAKAEPPKKTSSGGSPSIDDLLDNAVNGKRAEPKEEPSAPASSLPKTPSKDQMLPALGRAKAKVAACKGSGVATAAITITGKTGKATSVSVSGVDGAAKACVEKAVRSTPFPRFQNDTMKVQFPFKLGG